MNIDKKVLFFLLNNEFGFKSVAEHNHLNLINIFGNDKPVIVEIGSGKGEYLAIKSLFHPEQNFIGLEVKNKRIITTLKKLDIEKNKNVRLLNLLLDNEINKILPSSSIDEFIINHPDPWPKKRHHKRRLIRHDIIDTLFNLLKEGGLIRISTDNLEYAEWIKHMFDERPDFKSIYKEGYNFIVPEDHFITYFDKLQAELGFDPVFMLYKKIGTQIE